MRRAFKRGAAGLLAAVMVTSAATASGSGIRVLLDGETVTDSAYVDENYRTQIPAEVAQKLGLDLALTPGASAGDTTVVEGYVPLRYAAEAKGYSVAWAPGTAYLTSPGTETAVTNLPKLDMTQWQYHADDNVYYQIGIAYCETPADASHENLAIFVPGAYFTGTDNGDGTYTCEVNAGAAVNGYTADTAPMVMPIETPGYSAQAALTAYTSLTEYMEAGLVYVHAGCRGRDAGAPAGVTDLKAAIRYLRYVDDQLPGSAQRIFVFGMSGGGAQSALVGATGDSQLYAPYLTAIGAVQGVSDAVLGSMDWCPITSLDSANEAYEWMMGTTRSGLTEEQQAISDALAVAFADYVNAAGIKGPDGTVLTLAASEDGIYQAGSYYDYIKLEIETSLNNFLSDTAFPYDASSASNRDGGPGGGFGGETNAQGGYEDKDDISRTETASRIQISGTYEIAQDYIGALNAETPWVTYDAAANTATITSVADFVKAFKPTSKSLGAFDQLDAGQGENVLFGYGDGNGAHFDAALAHILAELGSTYASAYAADLQKADAQGSTAQQRLNMYSPLYYLMESQEGYRTSTPARYWRIRSGIAQSDTSLTTEVNLALALENYEGVESVDFAAVWGMQHVKAERTGSSTANFIQWVSDCLTPSQQETQPGPGNGGKMGGNGGNMGGNGGMRGGNGGGMMGMTSTDPAIQTVLDENAHKFEQRTFTDPDTGFALEYSLFVPNGYDGSQEYPLLMFIPDSTGAGKSARQIVEQYYGAAVWVTQEEQQKHPAFVVVPAFSETVVNDNWEVSGQVETAVKLLSQLQEDYAIDTNRIYATGQSMGCMTSLYLNSKYPDLFAASMFVSGQWDISVLKPLEEATFFYITAGGDANASGGQSEVMAMLDADGVPYTYGSWNAQNSDAEQAAAVEELLAQGLPINMVRFETGTVFKEGESGMEHMASFNYGYKLSAIRDWLFAQSKN